MNRTTVLLLTSLAIATTLAIRPVKAENAPKVDSSTAIETIKKMAAEGNPDAMLQLGEKLIPEQGTDSGATEALQWLQKAADAGKTQAWYDLGFIYANSAGVKEDLPRAINYWKTGAEKGNADCQFSVGLVYQAGERIPGGVKADPAEYAKWYKLAAEQNHQEAIYHLAQLYMQGEGVKQDSSEAAKWFRKGAEAGNPDAQWMLGICYRKGIGLVKNNMQAYALISAAVEGAENPDQKKGMAEATDKIGGELSPDQLKQAQKLAQEWIDKRAK
jgi:TPR repeat protein